MSIAIVSETRFTGSNNAVSARVWNYAQTLRMAGESVFLLSYGDYCRGGELSELSKSIFSYGTGNQETSSKRFFASLSTLVKSESIKAILFYPTPNPSFEIFFLLWKKQTRFSNVFCEINEVRRFEHSYSSTFSLPKRLLYNLVTKASEGFTRHYKGLVCISNTIKQYFLKYNSNAIVIPILSDIPNTLPPTGPIEDRHVTRFVFTGTVAIEKENLIELVRGFSLFDKEYKEWEFLLYGRIPYSNRKELDVLLREYRLTEKIRLMGEIDHSSIPGVLSEADCLILPRCNTQQNYYGFSTKLSEYAVSGTPIILTDTGVVFNYFQDGNDCLKVAGYDAEGFYEQLKRFISMSKENRNMIAQNAYKTAKLNFDWRLYSECLHNFLES